MKYSLVLVFIFTLLSCQQKETIPVEANPAAPGFNLTESDAKAIAIADEVMEAMGGRRAWDTTRFFHWSFMNRRDHIWDKIDQKSFISMPDRNMEMTIDLRNATGKVSRDGVLLPADSLPKYLEQGKRMWINDSYWLVMPFKLKDSGVTLKYSGRDTTQNGRNADVLQLTFNDVGVTPQNKYLVYVDDESRLVTQWDYYSSFQDSLPRFQSPWPNYENYGDLKLSGGQIGTNGMTNISVSQKLDPNVFE